MRSTTSSNVASWRGHSSVAHEHHSVFGMSPARMAARVRAIRWVHLAGTYDEVRELMGRRKGHFMKPGMLQSQFDALEAPADALTLPVLLPVEEQVRRIRATPGLG